MSILKFAICCYPGMELQKMIEACQYHKMEFEVIDLLASDWMDKVKGDFDCYLIRPPCIYDEHKSIFDERVYFIKNVLGKSIYPEFDELYTYENKRNMAAWLRHLGYPHPETTVVATKEDALRFIESTDFPIVSKSNIGAAGSAVKILKSKKQAKRIVNSIFGCFSSEFAFGFIPWGKKNGIPFPRISRSQRHYALFQEFLDISHEWRIIRIGDNFFGHQKLIGGNGLASGSDLVGWVAPRKELLDMVRKLTDEMHSTSMAVDILETKEGKLYINELQTIFGSYLPSQMYINGKPGMYRFEVESNEYVFIEGEFCQNACWNLRLEHIIKRKQ
ncbi:ATP-grasp domain-containing protein [Pseudoalteromonas rubra]|uniref:ATP-grasp domain-containing protein n=1 Tax=Pseudoalteromonas rubra TaxID=43658 RepID=UPI000F78C5AA|nr:hypothetical protein [Pseudoalteromonas rubra]